MCSVCLPVSSKNESLKYNRASDTSSTPTGCRTVTQEECSCPSKCTSPYLLFACLILCSYIMKANTIFEVGVFEPRASLARAAEASHKFLEGCQFYITPKVEPSRETLERIVSAAGGRYRMSARFLSHGCQCTEPSAQPTPCQGQGKLYSV